MARGAAEGNNEHAMRMTATCRCGWTDALTGGGNTIAKMMRKCVADHLKSSEHLAWQRGDMQAVAGRLCRVDDKPRDHGEQ